MVNVNSYIYTTFFWYLTLYSYPLLRYTNECTGRDKKSVRQVNRVNNQKAIFNTGPYGDPPIKIMILKIGVCHILSWPKIGLELEFYEAGTFCGFGKH